MRMLARGLIATLALTLVGCNESSDARALLPIGVVQKAHPFEKVIRHERIRLFPKATEVRLFVESGRYTKDGRSIPIEESGRSLSGTQRREVEDSISLITFEPTPDEVTTGPACFIPHHFFRYYDSTGRQIGEAAVCFCCAGAAINPTKRRLTEDQEYHLDIPKLKKLVSSMSLPTDIEC